MPGVAVAAVVGAARRRPHPRVSAIEAGAGTERVARGDARLDERFAPVRIRLVARRRERRGLVEIVARHREQSDRAGEAAGDEQIATAIEARPRLQGVGLQDTEFRVALRDRAADERAQRPLQDLRRAVVLGGVGVASSIGLFGCEGLGALSNCACADHESAAVAIASDTRAPRKRRIDPANMPGFLA